MRMTPLLALLLSLTAVGFSSHASADEINCAEVQLDSFLTSTGKLGVMMPMPTEGTESHFVEVGPGECFYEGALSIMRETCSGFGSSASKDEPAGPVLSRGATGLQPEAASQEELLQTISRLQRRVRFLRQQLHRYER